MKKKQRGPDRLERLQDLAKQEQRTDAAPDSGGQTGDTQDLSRVPQSSEESVEELVSTGQDIEAGELAGIERAANEPEREVHVEHPRREERRHKSSD